MLWLVFGRGRMKVLETIGRKKNDDDVALRWVVAGPTPVIELTYKELHTSIQSLRKHLTDSSPLLDRGERVVLLLEPCTAFFVAFLSCLSAGWVPVAAYPPTSSADVASLSSVVEDAGAVLIVASPLTHTVLDKADIPVVVIDPFDLPYQTSDLGQRLGQGGEEDDLAFLQYTSGSTGSPKGVMVTCGNVEANLSLLVESYGFGVGDHLVTWLPQYHDMGLLSVLTFLSVGGCVTGLSPLAFLKDPLLWLEAISVFGGTHGLCPNFGFELVLRKWESCPDPKRKASISLATLRDMMCGGEPIRGRALLGFIDLLGREAALDAPISCAYGLAESVALVTCVLPSDISIPLASVINLDRTDLDSPVSCGRPHPSVHLALRAVDTGEAVDSPRTEGEICVRSLSITPGYFGREHDDEMWWGDGYLRTGDLGVLDAEGALYVTGRLKEVIIVRGRNVHPHDIERAAEAGSLAAGLQVRPGRSAAFAGDDGGGVIVVLEAPRESGETEGVITDVQAVSIQRSVVVASKVTLRRVVVVVAGTIPRTGSGKIRRDALRKRWASGLGDDVVVAEFEFDVEDVGLDEVDAPFVFLDLESQIRARLRRLVAAHLGVDVVASGLDDVSMADLGIDSKGIVGLTSAIAAVFGADLSRHLVYDASYRDLVGFVQPLLSSL